VGGKIFSSTPTLRSGKGNGVTKRRETNAEARQKLQEAEIRRGGGDHTEKYLLFGKKRNGLGEKKKGRGKKTNLKDRTHWGPSW